MCEALKSLMKEEIEEEVEKGEAKVITLIQKLLAAGRMDDVQKVAEDSEYKKMLMKEFKIS